MNSCIAKINQNLLYYPRLPPDLHHLGGQPAYSTDVADHSVHVTYPFYCTTFNEMPCSFYKTLTCEHGSARAEICRMVSPYMQLFSHIFAKGAVGRRWDFCKYLWTVWEIIGAWRTYSEKIWKPWFWKLLSILHSGTSIKFGVKLNLTVWILLCFSKWKTTFPRTAQQTGETFRFCIA